MPTRRYFILDDALPGNEIRSMMGRVVEKTASPLFNYRPLEPPFVNEQHNTQDIIPSILPPAMPSGNRKDVLSHAVLTELTAKIMKVFGLDMSRNETERATIESEKVERYTLKQDEEVYKLLMRDAVYSRQVKDLVLEKGEAYFVSGFLTTENTKWDREATQKRKVGADSEVHIPAAATGGPPVDLELHGKSESSADQKTTEETHNKMIFAVQYDTIRSKTSIKIDSSGAKREKQPKFQRPTRAAKNQLAMGDDDEDLEVEDDEMEVPTSNLETVEEVDLEFELDGLQISDATGFHSIALDFEEESH